MHFDPKKGESEGLAERLGRVITATLLLGLVVHWGRNPMHNNPRQPNKGKEAWTAGNNTTHLHTTRYIYILKYSKI